MPKLNEALKAVMDYTDLYGETPHGGDGINNRLPPTLMVGEMEDHISDDDLFGETGMGWNSRNLGQTE